MCSPQPAAFPELGGETMRRRKLWCRQRLRRWCLGRMGRLESPLTLTQQHCKHLTCFLSCGHRCAAQAGQIAPSLVVVASVLHIGGSPDNRCTSASFDVFRNMNTDGNSLVSSLLNRGNYGKFWSLELAKLCSGWPRRQTNVASLLKGWQQRLRGKLQVSKLSYHWASARAESLDWWCFS